MALNIKNPEVEHLASEAAALSGQSKTEAIRQALLFHKRRLLLHRGAATREERLDALLRNRVWPSLPADVRGRPILKEEREQILGYGPEGV